MSNQQTAAEQMADALADMLWVVDNSNGVAGYHLNGEVAVWGQFEEVRIAWDALERWRAEQGGDGWMPIETAPSGRIVLVHYLNSHGKHRIIKARKVERYTVEAGDDDGCAEYDEANDRYTLLPGWWEQIDNWGDYTEVMVHEGEPDSWRELPANPIGSNQGG